MKYLLNTYLKHVRIINDFILLLGLFTELALLSSYFIFPSSLKRLTIKAYRTINVPAALHGVKLRLSSKNSTDNDGFSDQNYRLSNKIMEKNYDEVTLEH